MICSTCIKTAFRQTERKLLDKLAKQWFCNRSLLRLGISQLLRQPYLEETRRLSLRPNMELFMRRTKLQFGSTWSSLGSQGFHTICSCSRCIYGKCTGFTIYFICRSLSLDMCMDQNHEQKARKIHASSPACFKSSFRFFIRLTVTNC